MDQLAGPGPVAGSNGHLNDFSDAGKAASRANVLNAVADALDNIEVEGSFAGLAKAENFEDIGLSSRQAPYGKGSDTIVDTAVRNTWELDASQLEFHGGSYERTLSGAISFVHFALGITTPIRAELYKMLIYEKGAMFKAHTDTEKIPGMFGTLVICLPCPHEGGDVVVKHGGQTKTFSTSEIQSSFLCWYSDVHHEVLPVTSGYRCVLTFNLAIFPDFDFPNRLERPSAALLQDDIQKLRHALQRWLACGQQQDDGAQSSDNHVYYLLDHEYTEASISLNALKLQDLARVQCLKQLANELEFDILLAVLEKRQDGGVEMDWSRHGRRKKWYEDEDDYDYVVGNRGWHELDDVYETEFSIKKLVDLDGSYLRSGIKLDDAEVANNVIPACDDPFEDVKDRNEEYEGYMGNSGPTAIHWYRTSVAVLVPRDSMDGFLTRKVGKTEAQSMLRLYATKCKDAKSRTSALHTLQQLAKTAWGPNTTTPGVYHAPIAVDASVVYEVLKTAIELREYPLFRNVLNWVDAKDVDPLILSLVRMDTMSGTLELGEIKESLLQHFSKRPLRRYLVCLSSLWPVKEASHPEIEALGAEIIEQSLAKLDNSRPVDLREDDGAEIVNIVRSYKDYDCFKTRLVPVITKFISSTPFTLAAVLEFADWASEGVLPQQEALELTKILIKDLISAMDVATLRSKAACLEEHRAQAARYTYAYSRPAFSLPVSRIVSPGQLSELFKECIAHSWDDLLMTLSMKIAAQSSSIPPSEFQHLWLPFLHSFVERLNEASIPLTTPRYRQLILAILESYIDRFVGPEPPTEINWTVPGVNCDSYNCASSDCRSLDAFLRSPTRSTARFQIGKKRRQHLHQLLDRARSPCTHTTDRSTYPETLVVTKVIDKGIARNAWETRRKKAREALEGFRSDFDALLMEDYARIMRMVAPPDQRAAVGAGGAVSGSDASNAGTLPPLIGLLGQTQPVQGQSEPRLPGFPGVPDLSAEMRERVALGSLAGVKRKAEDWQ
ncbi:hypothetical protein C8A03DRAFT_29011 [Achaetomium macrosporum]|uniref:Prolyl 4-hydroxylase alpha subunit Fe(2+) 2OG dioxygenase domain-containing protein n=1 Tax=Achaetomium macrosporum TaxID=79813 RepID=A0AAN7CIM9_9PEZI|nr:hypothetical protein C8A03DRAFT_29011 [Achaetomium macrosporum]